jgi:hypothetical protein
MKTKHLLGICLIFSLVNTWSCSKKSPSQSEESVQQIEKLQQPAADQAADRKSTTQESVTVKSVKQETETVSVKTGTEQSESEEIEYFAVFMNGKKIGYATQKRKVIEDKVISTEETSMTMSRIGVSLTVSLTSSMTETLDGKPLSYECVQDLGLIKTETSGIIQPDGKLVLINTSAGSEHKSIIEWPSDALMTEGMRLLQEEKGLEEGTEYSYRIFDPTMVRAFDAKTTIGTREQVDLLGRVVTLREVTTILSIPEMGELTSKSYYDEDFNMQKSVTPTMGINTEIVACAKEFALGENDVAELVNNIFIDSPAPLNNLDSVESITYYLNPLPGAKLTIPPNDNQQIQQSDDGKVIITVTPVAAPAGATFPYNGDNEEILEALKPTQFVQNDNKTIIDLAHRAVGDTKDAAEAIKKIEAFVGDYVEDKNLSVGYASAVEVALSKQGDCTEHAVLTAALCKAVGIPAQVVTGIAYVEEWNDIKNVFGGHAWTQAYIGGKWIGLDAAFKGTNRGSYDAGHITLAAGNGSPGDFFSMITTMGNFKISKVEVRKK